MHMVQVASAVLVMRARAGGAVKPLPLWPVHPAKPCQVSLHPCPPLRPACLHSLPHVKLSLVAEAWCVLLVCME